MQEVIRVNKSWNNKEASVSSTSTRRQDNTQGGAIVTIALTPTDRG